MMTRAAGGNEISGLFCNRRVFKLIAVTPNHFVEFMDGLISGMKNELGYRNPNLMN